VFSSTVQQRVSIGDQRETQVGEYSQWLVAKASCEVVDKFYAAFPEGFKVKEYLSGCPKIVYGT
jgi:hypothetical protein